MTVFVEIKDGKATESTKNINIADKIFESYVTCDFDDYTPNNPKYTFNGAMIVLNPEYENILAQQEKEQRKQEILAELEQIDLKSIRALRAEETDRLIAFEEQAETLRQELRSL